MKYKLVRITTVPISLEKLLESQLRFMKENYLVTAISANKERLLTFGKKEGISTFHLELTRKITPIKDVIAVLKLYTYLKKEKTKIVHTHTPKAGVVGMLASYLANVPNRLHTVAGLPLLESKGVQRTLLNFVEKLTYRCATKIYPNSFGLKSIIIEEQFCKVSKLKVLANGSSNGIDTSSFNPANFSKEQNKILRKELAFEEEDTVFIFVGRLVGDKGINELVAAFDKLSKRFKSIKLLLVGAFESDLDPLKKNTLKMIDDNSAILSVGFQQDVRPYFAIADILVFPSYREGFPNVVLQAGAMGLPSIVSDINGCNEIIIEGKNGWIIPVKNSEAIFNTMQNCLKNQQQVFEIASQSREMITSRYEQQKVWNAILAEYQSLEENV